MSDGSTARRVGGHWRGAAAASLALLLVGSSTASAIEPPQLHGYLEEGFATGVERNGEVMFHRQTVSNKLTGDFSERFSYRVESDVWIDSADYLDKVDFRLRLREGFLKIAFDSFDIRVGRIQFAWGEADGVIVSDQVSPFDFTNFIVPPFDAIRMGVDAVSLDYYFDWGDDLQVLWIARFQSPDFPPPQSPWSFTDEDELAARGLSLGPTDDPAVTFGNSEYGIRYSGHPAWMDWSVGYLHSIDDRPAPKIIGGTVIPTHREFDLLMAAFTAPVGEVLIRFDSVLELDRLLSTAPTTDPPSPESLSTADAGFVARQDVSRTLLGLDMKPKIPGWEQPDASLQYVHEEVLDPHAALAEAEHADYLSVLLRAAYFNETLKPWIFYIHNVRGADSWLQLRIDYEPFDNWRFSLEYDRFHGHAFDPDTDTGGIYGRFADNDLVQFTIRRSY